MGRTSRKQTAVDYADLQGLVRFGFGNMVEASYALLQIRNAAAARAWLRATPFTTAAELWKPTWLCIIASSPPWKRHFSMPVRASTA